MRAVHHWRDYTAENRVEKSLMRSALEFLARIEEGALRVPTATCPVWHQSYVSTESRRSECEL